MRTAKPSTDRQQQGGIEPGHGTPVLLGASGNDAPTKRGNKLAIAGAATSLIPPVGLVMSIMGLNRSKTVNGAGKAAATAGIVLSLAFAGSYSFAIAQATRSGGSDPVCASATSALHSMDDTFSTDAQNGMNWQTAPAALMTEVTNDAADVGNARAEVDTLIAKSTHADIKAKLQDVDNALIQTGSDFDNTNANPFTGMQTLSGLIAADSTAIGKLCGGAGS